MTTPTLDPTPSAPAVPPREGRASRRSVPRLSGTAWLVWRQHRAAYWTLIGLTLVGVVAMVWLRGQLMDQLNALDASGRKSEGLPPDFEKYTNRLFTFGSFLGYVPVLLGVFLGAPLIAGDLESGTAKLVTSQSVSRLRWLTTKLVMTAGLIALCTAVLGAVFTWWWGPLRGRADTLEWTSNVFFDGTGPVPVAYALLTFSVGVAVGMVLRRTLVSMVVTLGVVGALSVVWDRFRLDLGHVMTATTHNGGDGGLPTLPDQAVQQGQGAYFLTSSGQKLDWTTCLAQQEHTKAHTACLESKDVIGRAVDYLPVSQMHTMQWLGAGLMLAVTAAVVAFVLTWGRGRLL
ncbi:ABC transporter permease [Streptomyces tubbatahanensis]|uniref:ABC transporter permease n=1 Tax=Streptomyces tubbatahanensis TaxID=2923272 RepID=A0ABY3XQP6_9ACTN|nr:ABC transporter permease subunit [Streptomyces tubbatahanensis]UNS96767.1 ABC transporter permease [Streptomyces tubbatahanensis]